MDSRLSVIFVAVVVVLCSSVVLGSRPSRIATTHSSTWTRVSDLKPQSHRTRNLISGNIDGAQAPHRSLRDPARAVPVFVTSLKENSTIVFPGVCVTWIHVSITDITHRQPNSTRNQTPIMVSEIQLEYGPLRPDFVHIYCSESYLIATPEQFYLSTLDNRNGQPADVTQRVESDQMDEVEILLSAGWQIFQLPDGILGEIVDLFQFYQLISADEAPEFYKRFLGENMGLKFVPRPQVVVNISDSDVENGDYIAQHDMDGEGALIVYGTGGTSDHAAIAMWIDEVLYVLESTDTGIQRTPFQTWVGNAAVNPNLHTVLVKLSPERRQMSNFTAAVEWFKTVEGLRYGWQTFAFGWIDTAAGNYPYPLSSEFMPMLLMLMDSFFPVETETMFLLGLNHRLGTNGLRVRQIIDILTATNSSIVDLLAVPEGQGWLYPTGPNGTMAPALVCSAFVTEFYRQAGMFKDEQGLDLDINSVEFTPKDTYEINIFDSSWNRPDACKVDNLPYCQLTGMYLFEMPLFNTIEPYSHMNEHCSSLPPHFVRTPVNC